MEYNRGWEERNMSEFKLDVVKPKQIGGRALKKAERDEALDAARDKAEAHRTLKRWATDVRVKERHDPPPSGKLAENDTSLWEDIMGLGAGVVILTAATGLFCLKRASDFLNRRSDGRKR